MSADRHEPFHELLAERMDGPLDADRAAQLERHLADCASCRTVAKEYEADRQRLRAIQDAEPPRDLWARTSAALDREVADEADALLRPGFGGSRGPRQFRVAIGSFVAAMLILALTGGQLLPGAPSPGLPTATPFAIPAEAVSYVGVTNGQLTFYRASVGEVCPPPRLDCADGPDGEAVVRFASGVHAREMTLSRSGQLFVSGSDELGEEIFAIVTLPAPEPPIGSAGIEPQNPSPDATSTSGPEASEGPGETRNPDVGQGDPPTPQPTDGPDVLPSPSTDPAGDPSAGPSISPPPGSATAVATTQSILKDALATGRGRCLVTGWDHARVQRHAGRSQPGIGRLRLATWRQAGPRRDRRSRLPLRILVRRPRRHQSDAADRCGGQGARARDGGHRPRVGQGPHRRPRARLAAERRSERPLRRLLAWPAGRSRRRGEPPMTVACTWPTGRTSIRGRRRGPRMGDEAANDRS